MLIHPSPGGERPAAIVPKAERGQGSQPLIIYHLLTTRGRQATPPMPITPLRAKLLLSFPLYQPAKRVRGPPFSVKWLPRGCPRLSELVTKSKLGRHSAITSGGAFL